MKQSHALAHRMASKTLQLVDASGQALARQEVKLNLTNHKFLFGCGLFESVDVANRLVSDERMTYLETKIDLFLDVFNSATLPFYWGRFEPEQGKPLTKELQNAAKWLKERNINVKGHPLCWHTVTAPWLLDMSNEEILKVQLDRIQRDVTDFKGLIDTWDVINEVVIMPIFDKYDNGITRIAKELGRVGIIKEMFAKAREFNPEATLILNDFNTSINYEILIDGCLQAGIPIDVIGIQSHQHQGYWGREKLEEVLERFSQFGLPIHFTENTLISGELMPLHIVDLNDHQVTDWPSTPEFEQRQAEEVEEMYTILFEHPLVESIVSWKFSDEQAWLNAPAGFVRKDNSTKPSYDVVKRLIKEQWSTNITLQTDEDGYVTFEGVLGEYELISGDKKASFMLDKNAQTERMVIS